MQTAKRWLILTAVLFIAWIGYLAYLAYQLHQEAAAGGGQPIVLSRPQFLVADLIVIARVEEGKPNEAHIQEVRWARHAGEERWAGQTILVEDLDKCQGLHGSGDYILPLANLHVPFRVAAVPPSPGFPPNQEPRIYPKNDFTMEQLEVILAELHKH